MSSFAQKAPQRTSDTSRRPPVARSAASSPIQQLQRRVGNQALQRMLQAHAGKAKEDARYAVRIQPKLTINTPGDAYEQEADRVAEQVMRMPEPLARPMSIQRSCASCEADTNDVTRKNLHAKGVTDDERSLNSQEMVELPADREEEIAKTIGILRKSSAPEASGGPARIAPPIVPRALRSGGQPLERGARSFMEARFGRDFGQVRIHTNPEASALRSPSRRSPIRSGRMSYFARVNMIRNPRRVSACLRTSLRTSCNRAARRLWRGAPSPCRWGRSLSRGSPFAYNAPSPPRWRETASPRRR